MSLKITRISATKRGRFALFVDDEFLFSIDDETMVQYHIQEGSLLTNEELSALKDASDIRKAKNQALRYLSLRAYAQEELYQKLCLKYDTYTSAAAIQAMVELDLLDDENFAVEKAKGLMSRGKSSSEIRRQLQALGIGANLISTALQMAEPNDEENAYKVLKKGGYMEKLARGEREKVMAALARRGFGHSTIRTVVDRALNEIKQNSEDMF